MRESLVHSQIDLHALYGGVVPDLASSEHLKKLPALIAKISKSEYFSTAGEIAATNGPGLPNCLAIGVAAASALALKLGLPLRGVNHLRGHAYSPFIPVHAADPQNFRANFAGFCRILGLAVSAETRYSSKSGRTRKYRPSPKPRTTPRGRLSTRARSCWECPTRARRFWKSSPEAEKSTSRCFPTARTGKSKTTPVSSFSGLKTSLRYRLEKMAEGEIERAKPDICASYQFAVVEQLRRRAEWFARRKAYKSVGVSGASQTTRPSSPRSRGSRAPAARASSPPTGGTGATTPR